MEMLSKLRWFIVGFVVLIVVILLGWGLISIARGLFNSSSSGDTALQNSDDIVINSIETARFTVSGPIVATEEHRSYTVEVNDRIVTITLYSDYGQKQIARRSYPNNDAAFQEFMEALDKAEVLQRRSGTDSEDDFDYEGACPTGRRYIIQLNDDVTRWSSSCSNALGTAGGSVRTIRRLFNEQVPDISDVLKGTRLYIN